MLFSWSWLGEYVDLGTDREGLAHRLTMAGLPVEQMETVGEIPPTVVMARVLEAKRHPNADKLSLCTVDVGEDEPLQIVCGAPNARTGLISALARVGTVMPNGMKIKKSKIRGEVSFGMLCSNAELGLGDDHDGILDFPDGEPGTPLADRLGPGDTVMDIDVASNRGDCMSHYGLAREVSAVTGAALRPPTVAVTESGDPASSQIAVEVEDFDDCPRYLGRVIRGITVGPSPEWLVKKLEAAGQRSINNIVDVTNFILLESGQPLHAFDLQRLGTGKIAVRRARQGETMTTLDGVERVLDPEILLITDGTRPVALAGIMGGADTEVEDDTTDILLEGAVFHPGRVLRGSRRLRLDTEASIRFRRGVDPLGTPEAMDRAAALMAELGGGTVAPGHVDVNDPAHLAPRTVVLRPQRVGELLGEDLDETVVASRLEGLGFELDRSDPAWTVTVPSWRRDIFEECDLTEEVARVGGYDAIGVRQFNASAVNAPVQAEETDRRRVSELLRGFGFHEAMTRSLQAADAPGTLGIDPGDAQVTVADGPSREESVLRVSLLPSLLQVMSHNLRHGQPEARVFEFGRTFERRDNDFPVETDWVALAAAGGEFAPSRERGVRDYDLPAFKGVIESVLDAFGHRTVRWSGEASGRFLPPGALGLSSEHGEVGYLWETPPGVSREWDLRRPVFLAQIRVDALAREQGVARHADTSRFPAVRRDLALVVPAGITQAEARDLAVNRAGQRLESIELFDYYEGEHIPEGHVGLGFSLTFRAPDRTLEESEVDRSVGKVVKALRDKGIVLRDT